MKQPLLWIPLTILLMGFTTENRGADGQFIAALVDAQVTRAKTRCEGSSNLCPNIKENLTVLAEDIEALCVTQTVPECQGLLDTLDYIHTLLIEL
ncbi:MAG TPA: hypothetical protein DCZ03_01360 [Gammaproteobacteria bacterium]|nr:hypothetical protein [Gammaproteobacteria bacterium]